MPDEVVGDDRGEVLLRLTNLPRPVADGRLAWTQPTLRRQSLGTTNGATTKSYTFGTCAYDRTSPPRTALSPETKVLNIFLTFEEAR